MISAMNLAQMHFVLYSHRAKLITRKGWDREPKSGLLEEQDFTTKKLVPLPLIPLGNRTWKMPRTSTSRQTLLHFSLKLQ